MDLQEIFMRFCIVQDNRKTMESLLKSGVSMKKRGPDGLTLLTLAATIGRVEIARLLLDSYDMSEVDIQCADDVEALLVAVELGYVPFLKKWADCQLSFKVAKPDGEAPLHRVFFAWHEGTCETIDFLIDHAADVRAKDGEGLTALHHLVSTFPSGSEASQLVFQTVVSIFMNAGSDINAQDALGRTPLHYAMIRRDSYLFLFDLLENGADVGIEDHLGVTVFDLLLERWLENKKAHWPESFGWAPEQPKSAFYEISRTLIFHVIGRKALGLRDSDNIYSIIVNMGDWLNWMQHQRPRYSNKYTNCCLNTVDFLDSFYEKCQAEGEKLKNTRVDSNTSLFDVMLKSHSQTFKFANKLQLKDYISSERCKEDFPCFWYHLRLKFTAAIENKKFKPIAMNCLRSVGVSLPDLCLDLILSYLSNSELANFIDVVHSIIACQNKRVEPCFQPRDHGIKRRKL